MLCTPVLYEKGVKVLNTLAKYLANFALVPHVED
jgi:hypothetical protein